MRARMNGGIGFVEDILPMFRDGDRSCMAKRGIELGDWWDVRRNADQLFSMLSSGKMPPDSPWTKEQFGKFADWREEGMPKRRAENEVVLFSEIDKKTEFENPPGSGLMNQAMLVMQKIFPSWKDYAAIANPASATTELDVLRHLLQDVELRKALLAIDNMLCGIVQAHFVDSDGILDALALIDAYENFGRDRFPPDPERGEIPGHFDGGFHRMDSTSMWFNWGAQLECAVIILGAMDKWHSIRAGMMAGLTCGCPMEFIFRVDDKGSGKTNPRAKTDPQYVRNIATESLIRQQAKRYINDWDSGSNRMRELYRFFLGQ